MYDEQDLRVRRYPAPPPHPPGGSENIKRKKRWYDNFDDLDDVKARLKKEMADNKAYMKNLNKESMRREQAAADSNPQLTPSQQKTMKTDWETRASSINFLTRGLRTVRQIDG